MLRIWDRILISQLKSLKPGENANLTLCGCANWLALPYKSVSTEIQLTSSDMKFIGDEESNKTIKSAWIR